MENKRIILDTNLWISFLITNQFTELDELIETDKIILIFSDELLAEFIDVVSRPNFKNYFTHKKVEKILSYFDLYGQLITVFSNEKICRDHKDDFLLNLSIDTKANYLGDKDLLVLGEIRNTKILNFKQFIEDFK
jgi:hypothetical protein